MSPTRADVIAYLESLDAHALGELVDELQRRIGPRPRRPARDPRVIMGMAPESAAVLTGFDEARKIHLLKELRTMRRLSVAEAVALLNNLPFVLVDGCSHGEAEQLAAQLRQLGAKVEVRST